MGDIADWIIDNMIDNACDLGDYDDSFDDEDYFPTRIECKFCKETGLKWTLCESGYRLVDENNTIHECKEYLKQMKRIRI